MDILAIYLVTTWSILMSNDLPDFFLSKKLRIDTSSIPNAGLGVFATEDISPGEILERAPVIPFSIDALEAVIEYTDGMTVLADVCFGWNARTPCIALGWGGIYNHSIEMDNVTWYTSKEIQCIEYSAKKFIQKGEELFIRYRHRNAEPRDFEEEAWLEKSGLLDGNSDYRRNLGVMDENHGTGFGWDNRKKSSKRKNRDGCFKSISPGLSWKSDIKS